MNKKLLITGSILGMLGIILGAFAAHGLKALISTAAIATFETGVRYQIYHAFFLLFLGNTTMVSLKMKSYIFYCILFGVLLFSGSIYGLATNVLTAIDFKTIGFVTPIGGLGLIFGWGLLLWAVYKHKVN